MRSASRSTLRILMFFGALVLAAVTAYAAPPPTRSDNVADTLHGTVVIDPYRWLEKQDAPETRAWIDAQNAYTKTMLDPIPGRDLIHARLEELLKTDTQSVPFEQGGRYFFSRRLANQELSILYMRRGAGGKDEVLLDPHPMSADHTTSVGFIDVTDDGKLMAYSTRLGGKDEVKVSFMDLDTRKDLPDVLPEARYFGVSIKNDKSGFFYSKYTGQGSRIYYHAMGSDPAKDVYLFGDGYGPGIIASQGLSEDGRWLLIVVSFGSATDKSEVYVKDVAADGPIVPIVKDVDAYFAPDIAGDYMYLKTNWDASNWRVFKVSLKDPAREHWKEIIPASDAVIEDVAPVGGKLFVRTMKNVSYTTKIYDTDGHFQKDIAFPTLGTASGMNGRWGGKEGFFTFASFATPTTIFHYDVTTGARTTWWRAPIPVQSDRFEVKQVWFTSKDGTKVPMFVAMKKGLKLDGARPTLLTGYGGFSLAQLPNFSSRATVWMEQGGVYALPNLRGGDEFGEAWHKAGMLEKKQNVFDDFIGAAQWLIANGYTNSEHLAISGGSNGGLLVGAAMTQRPDLYRAVVCSIPLLDMLRYQNFLVARFWVPEYGSAENPDQFKFISAYSPYQNVKPGEKYPAVMFISGDGDTRVDPLHARKMTARMQAATGSDRPILLHYDSKAGHSGGKPLSKQINDLAEELLFLDWQLGVKPVPMTGGAGAGAGAAPNP